MPKGSCSIESRKIILAFLECGKTIADVAEGLGVTTTRVYQMLGEIGLHYSAPSVWEFPRECHNCGTTFMSNSRSIVKYCSGACKRVALCKIRCSAGRRWETLVCPCGKTFTCCISNNRKYCSRSCSSRFRVRASSGG